MTPRIVVTFLLLVFFMVTVQFKTLEGLLAARLPEPLDPIDVRIDVLARGTPVELDGRTPWSGSGPFRFAPDRRVRWSVGPWSTLDPDELAPRLATVFRHESDRRVAVDARPGTVYSEVVAAVDAARLAGYTDVAFAR